MSCSATRELIRPQENADFLNEEESALLNASETLAPLPVVRNTDQSNIEFLRKISLPVSPSDPAVSVLLNRMKATVELEKGVGIAAPQIGISRRAIWVLRLDKTPEAPFEACLNPVITRTSSDKETDWEGCLSVTEGFGMVSRPQEITIRYQGTDGAWREETISGFTARIFQHEIDHLDGVLFIDRMDKEGKILPEDEYRAMRNREKEEKEREINQAPDS